MELLHLYGIMNPLQEIQLYGYRVGSPPALGLKIRVSAINSKQLKNWGDCYLLVDSDLLANAKLLMAIERIGVLTILSTVPQKVS
jgi:hypothetical protein